MAHNKCPRHINLDLENCNFKVTFDFILITHGENSRSNCLQELFLDFLTKQPTKVQNKIFKIIDAIETLERIPTNYLKQITGTNGLYEARIQLGTDIWRVFCFFDKGRLVILLNGFQKKTQKTPKNEIEKAINLMKEYYESRK